MEIGREACCNNSLCLGFVKLKLATSNRNDLGWGKRGVQWQTQAELLGVLGARGVCAAWQAAPRPLGGGSTAKTHRNSALSLQWGFVCPFPSCKRRCCNLAAPTRPGKGFGAVWGFLLMPLIVFVILGHPQIAKAEPCPSSLAKVAQCQAWSQASAKAKGLRKKGKLIAKLTPCSAWGAGEQMG